MYFLLFFFAFFCFVCSIGMIDPILCCDRIDVKNVQIDLHYKARQMVWPKITTLYPINRFLILTFLRAKCISLFFSLSLFVLHAKVFILIKAMLILFFSVFPFRKCYISLLPEWKKNQSYSTNEKALHSTSLKKISSLMLSMVNLSAKTVVMVQRNKKGVQNEKKSSIYVANQNESDWSLI